MTSIVLFEEFQSLGTVQLVPEVRKMTVGEDCDAACCGSKKKDAMNIDAIISANAIGTWRTAEEARNILIVLHGYLSMIGDDVDLMAHIPTGHDVS